MVAGARALSLGVARADLATALEGLSREDVATLLLEQLAALARRTGQPALFLALSFQAARERAGVA